jgi:sporulation protein YlmC with PRC-barrel domain
VQPLLRADPAQLDGVTVHDSDGGKIGKVTDVYLDEQTSKPEWAAVKTGMFGGHVSLVPLANASFDGEALKVPYSKDQVKNAPHQDPAQELSPAQEAEIFEHYGVPYGGETVTAQPGGQGKQESAQTGGKGKQESGQQESGQRAGSRGVPEGQTGGPGQDTSGPNTDKAMTPDKFCAAMMCSLCNGEGVSCAWG